MPLRIWVIGTRTSSAPVGERDRGAGRARRVGRAGPRCGGGRGRRRARRGAGAGAAAAARAPLARRCGRGGRAADGLAADRLAGALGLDVVRDVLAGDPPAAAGADDLRGGQAVLAEEAPDGGRHAGVGVAGRVGGRGRGRRPRRGAGGRAAATALAGARGAGRAVGGRSVGRRRRPARALVGAGAAPCAAARRAAAAGPRLAAVGGASVRAATRRVALVGRLDDRDLGVVRDGRALLDEDLLEDARERRRNLGVDLVGDDLDQRLVLRDGVAGLLQPLADRPLGHALAELGHRHLGHWSFLRVAGRIGPAITLFGA